MARLRRPELPVMPLGSGRGSRPAQAASKPRVRSGVLAAKNVPDTNSWLSIADVPLASHLTGVERFGVDLAEFPRAAAVGESLFAIPEFAAAHPSFQLGAPVIRQ